MGILSRWREPGMSEALLADVRFHRLLLAYDEDLARRERSGRCRRCGGVLHSARYRRKPRGLPPGLGEEYRQRFSFCCAVRECRRRKTILSLRFLGRKVYAAAILVLVSALRHGATPATRRRLQALVGASRRTVTRWDRSPAARRCSLCDGRNAPAEDARRRSAWRALRCTPCSR